MGSVSNYFSYGDSVKRKTTEQFIKEAKKVHGDKYDYSLTEYKNTDTKVKIICPKHGVFEQRPHDHLKGHGCDKCAKELSSIIRSSSLEQFIKKAKKIHGDKYDYSLVDYKNNHTKVKIICPIHGEFEQIPYVHLKGANGCDCPKCVNCKKYTPEEFIKKAKEYFPMYDYSLVDYKNSYTKVKIICSKHGEWNIRPNDLLNGHGCPKCQESKGEKNIREWLLKNGFKEGKDFECQKRFKECKDKRALPFDFYFKPKDILIEYQGFQHYYEINNRNNLAYIKLHDKIKREYAEKFHNFLEISYKDFKNIDEILMENLL